jgi:hypothetical protein
MVTYIYLYALINTSHVNVFLEGWEGRIIVWPFFPLSEAIELLLAQFPLLSTDCGILDQTN